MTIIVLLFFIFLFRIDYDTMVIADPESPTGPDSAADPVAAKDSINTGDCITDTISSTFHCKLY